MELAHIPAGRDVPDDIYVIVEISANSGPVKYEMDERSGILRVDRFLSADISYPCNYGYINHTLSPDGDPSDVMVYTAYPLQSPSVISCRPIGLLEMRDESGQDNKILAVPGEHVSRDYGKITDIENFPAHLRDEIINFFRSYKAAEENRWIEVGGWKGAREAKLEIRQALARKRDHLPDPELGSPPNRPPAAG